MINTETCLVKLNEQSRELFKNTFKLPSEGTTSCPGRINILGEHTDYLGGLAMPAAISRHTLVSYAPTQQQTFRFWSQSHKELWETDFSLCKRPAKNWQKFAYGALSIIKELISDMPEQYKPRHGACFSIMGNIPLGKGLSSSASLELCLLNSLYELFSLNVDPMNSIRLAQRIEQEFLGVPSGLLDQFACQFSDREKIQIVDFNSMSMRQDYHKGLANWSWICIDSGVKRALGSSEYPKRVQQCQQALRTIQNHETKIDHFRKIKYEHLKYLEKQPILRSRMSHMIEENQRTLEGFDALKEGRITELGQLLNESHNSLKSLFEVSTSELDCLQAFAIEKTGCVGARMMGGGFGGCTLNLVKKDSCIDFISQVLEAYSKEFNIHTQAYVFDLVDGVTK